MSTMVHSPQQPAPTATLQALFNSMRPALAKVLPKHLTPERIVKVALLAAMKQPKLVECSRDSLINALLQSAEVGLEPGSALNQVFLIPYWNAKNGVYEAQFQMGYQGLLELARRSDKIARVGAKVVYAKDGFEYEEGDKPFLKHRPFLDGDRGPMRLAYCVVKLKDTPEDPQIEVMTRDQIEAIKEKSKARAGRSWQWSPWVSDGGIHEAEMWRKTVCKRALKWAPKSIELARALEADNQEPGDGPTLIELPALPAPPAPQETAEALTKSATERAKEAILAKKQKAEPGEQQQMLHPEPGEEGEDSDIPT